MIKYDSEIKLSDSSSVRLTELNHSKTIDRGP